MKTPGEWALIWANRHLRPITWDQLIANIQVETLEWKARHPSEGEQPGFNIDLSKPNHFYDDNLGDPYTCTEDHNHPAPV